VAFQRKTPAAIGAKAPFPGFIQPALATSIAKAATGERRIHEIDSGTGVMILPSRFTSWMARSNYGNVALAQLAKFGTGLFSPLVAQFDVRSGSNLKY
jgi:hypothetical protein